MLALLIGISRDVLTGQTVFPRCRRIQTTQDIEQRGLAGSRLAAHRDEDVASVARVAVVGPDIQTALFAGGDPLGQQIRIGNVPFQVKGLLVTRGAGPGGSSLDSIVFIPVTTASRSVCSTGII